MGHLRSIAEPLMWRNSLDSISARLVPNPKSYQINGMLSQGVGTLTIGNQRLCHAMRYVDLAVILVYLIGITWFGARFGRGQKSLRDYFLGGRTAPWWAISLSIVSAEISTLTIVGTPALAFAGNLGFLHIVLGYLLARIVISIVFLP